MFYLIFSHGNFYRKMRKANPIKPTTKESYAKPKAQTQPSNGFEVLGKIPKPFAPTSSNPIYKSKEARQLIQVLEADHRSASGSFDLQKIFQQDKFFVSNEISKTRRFLVYSCGYRICTNFAYQKP